MPSDSRFLPQGVARAGRPENALPPKGLWDAVPRWLYQYGRRAKLPFLISGRGAT
jgi:hypothetical protein